MNEYNIIESIEREVKDFKKNYGKDPENLYLGITAYEALYLYINGSKGTAKGCIATFRGMDVWVLLVPRCILVCARKAHDVIKDYYKYYHNIEYGPAGCSSLKTENRLKQKWLK